MSGWLHSLAGQSSFVDINCSGVRKDIVDANMLSLVLFFSMTHLMIIMVVNLI